MISVNTQYSDQVQIVQDLDFNASYALVNDKVSDIENWINNLALLNQNINYEDINNMMNKSVLSDDEEKSLDEHKIERQIISINQIANSGRLISTQKGYQR